MSIENTATHQQTQKDATMPTNIRIIHAHDFIKATPEGRLNFEESKKLLMEIAAASRPMIYYEIILDTRKAKSVIMSADQLWLLAAELIKYHAAFSRKTAVICPLEQFDYAEFFALCAQERGFKISAFTSLDDAIEWLSANGT
jgi:hypothetical protein